MTKSISSKSTIADVVKMDIDIYDVPQISDITGSCPKSIVQLACRRGMTVARLPRAVPTPEKPRHKVIYDRKPQISGEQYLWQSVVRQAVVDAAYRGEDRESRHEKVMADHWLRGNGSDFRHVCNLAVIDPDFLHEAYVNGRIDRDRLKSAQRESK